MLPVIPHTTSKVIDYYTFKTTNCILNIDLYEIEQDPPIPFGMLLFTF
jgi:hypothetical protein